MFGCSSDKSKDKRRMMAGSKCWLIKTFKKTTSSACISLLYIGSSLPFPQWVTEMCTVSPNWRTVSRCCLRWLESASSGTWLGRFKHLFQALKKRIKMMNKKSLSICGWSILTRRRKTRLCRVTYSKASETSIKTNSRRTFRFFKIRNSSIS